MATDPRHSVIEAANLIQATFEREFGSSETGVVLPGAIAVDEQGQELTKIAAVFEQSHPPTDRLYGQTVERALRQPSLERAVACAALRIDVGCPRILAWHCHDETALVLRPEFDDLKLIVWHEQWRSALADSAPSGSTEGLVSISSGEINSGAFGLLVGARLQSEAEDHLSDLRDRASDELHRRTNTLGSADPFPDFWIISREGQITIEPLPILAPVPLQRVFATFQSLVGWGDVDVCSAVFVHRDPDGDEQVNLVAVDRASAEASLGMARLRREQGKAVLYEDNLDQLPEQADPLPEAEQWPLLSRANLGSGQAGQLRDEADPRVEVLDRRVRATLTETARRLSHPELDFPAFTTCLDGQGDTFALAGLVLDGPAAAAVAAERAIHEAKAMVVAIPSDSWDGDQLRIQLRYFDGDNADMFSVAFIERRPNQPGKVVGRSRYEPHPGRS